MKKICEVLGSTQLFRGLTHELYHDNCESSNIRTFWKGEIIINEGDVCPGVYVIVDGQVAMQKYSSNGEFVTLDLLGPLDVFGVRYIFGSRKYFDTTMEAVSTCRVVLVSRDNLLNLISRSPKLLHNYLQILSDTIRLHERRINLLSQKSLRQKISTFLLNLLYDQLENEGETLDTSSQVVSTHAVELPVSKEVVSRLLAMPRPSFSRELISMEKDGLVKVSGRVIWLTDVEGLAKGLIDSDSKTY
ncbi:MAG: Crp/Fnr family transcriptional regulator [Clostridiaceae bacterium]|nr:Crp/Fnr family transcriptional regulator [Clostridiaceae bacterium]